MKSAGGVTRAVIVGCGPAGLAAAYFLLQKGVKVTAVERLEANYEKYHAVCGAGISRAALKGIGLRPPVLNEVSHTVIEWPDGSALQLRSPGYVLDRVAFLKDLYRKSAAQGAEFVHGRVADVTDGAVVLADGRRIAADYVLGADGTFSVVRKKVFGTEPAELIPASEHWAAGQATELHFKVGAGGYSWTFPAGSRICQGVTDRHSGRGRFIPIGGVGPIVKGHVLLLGDAAGMANPVSFAGLRAALTAGSQAAAAVARNDLGCYAAWWEHSILSDVRFMEFRTRLLQMSPPEISRLASPFRSGHIYLTGLRCVLTRPADRLMYFGCLQAFRHSW